MFSMSDLPPPVRPPQETRSRKHGPASPSESGPGHCYPHFLNGQTEPTGTTEETRRVRGHSGATGFPRPEGQLLHFRKNTEGLTRCCSPGDPTRTRLDGSLAYVVCPPRKTVVHVHTCLLTTSSSDRGENSHSRESGSSCVLRGELESEGCGHLV